MEKIPVEELVKYKMLPFDLYNENGEKLVDAGEILTSGKLLQISQYDVLFKSTPKHTESRPTTHMAPATPVADMDEESFEPAKPKEIVFDKTVNRKSKFKAQSQVDMKSYYATTMFALRENANKDAIQMVDEIKDKILDDVQSVIQEVKFCSQLKLLGNYNDCHALNTAILATAMGYKLEYDEDVIEKLAQASLLHDIGMTRLPKEILEKTSLSQQDNKLFQKHTQMGYKILKYEMGLPEDICLVALEHHENNDGSGYPFKLSGEQISKLTRVVGLCSFFDDLTSNRTVHKVKNTKEALRIMLEVGTKKFFPELLYQFVNMFNYNDLESYDEMIQ
ncbi:MAG: HD-GYP domain-containing protein [Opitutales bacterium]|jgi:metal dependent phosphohydrolase|nr:HD domain-containing protein [Clostridium sp.]